MAPVAGAASAPTSSMTIVFDWALTTVATFCLPLEAHSLSKD
jgi:hypothetical protein